jgi:hypothetical protein
MIVALLWSRSMSRPTPTYSSWIQMRQRCLNPRHKNYADYGGRGIAIDPRWNSFANFLADMGEKPAGLTLERLRVNDGYGPSNCRWATRRDQSRNRRDTVSLTHEGVTKPLAEWADQLGLKKITIHMRLRRGCTHAEALAPENPGGARRKSNRLLTHDNKTLPLYEWAKATGIPRKVLTLRLFSNWSVERALTTPVRPTPKSKSKNRRR